jgi:hypothetical protein
MMLSFIDSNTQATCSFAGFGLVVGIFLGVIGLILLIVGAIQLGTKRKETISGQSHKPLICV